MRNGRFVIVVAIADAVEQKRPFLHPSAAGAIADFRYA
jgi:hypothetical protein